MKTKTEQFTPGPWSYSEASGYVWGADEDTKICMPSLAGGAMDANARLIAAAPELLEALQTIKDRCGASGTSRHDRLIWTIADTAIRKAKGEL